MAPNTPRFLVAEIQSAFRQCAQLRRQRTSLLFAKCYSRQFQTAHGRHARRARSSLPAAQQTSKPHDDLQLQFSPSESTLETPSTQTSDSCELVPQDQRGRALGGRRTTDAPMKIIPRANITPNLQLSPKERLHIEILTRRPPPQTKQVKSYKERLLIYHQGNLSNNALVFLKVLGLVCASTVSVIFVPAHYFAGTALWICGSLLISGWIPAILFHRILRPLVTRVYLRLPPTARVSPDAAMKYAKSLPSSAQIDVDFTRMTALPGTITVNVSDIQPLKVSSRWPWHIANFKWVGPLVEKGSLLRRNPIEFYMKKDSGAGKAKRDVIPGIWPEVLKRLTGATREPTSRWKRA